MPHRYRITVQEADEVAGREPGSLSFEVSNHDDLLQLVTRVRDGGALPEAEVAEMTVGLKLFSSVLLRHRNEPLFAELFPHMGAFIKRLKAYGATQA